jgi:sugar phosphate isomerase/epimerase
MSQQSDSVILGRDLSEWALSGFADEVDPALSVQLETFNRLGIKGLDLRSVNGTNVLDLSQDEIFRIGDQCREARIHVQSIGSPVNKIPYNVLNRANELEKLGKAIKAANHLLVKRIRLFTPEVVDEDGDSSVSILAWMSEQKAVAEDGGVTLIVENDARYWSAYPENAKRLFGELGGPSFKAAFDFANTVLIGYRPMTDWFPWLLPHLDTLHIKDAIESDQKVVPAGEGEGQIEQTLEWLIQQGWTGPLTLEPHLQAAGKLGGFSGPALFEAATTALRTITDKLGVPL